MANLPFLTLAAAAAQGYGQQMDANRASSLDAAQQSFDNGIKTRTLDQSAAEAAARNKFQQAGLDQAANTARANIIAAEQSQIEARLKGMRHDDPGAAPLIQRHIQNANELSSLFPGAGGRSNAAPTSLQAPSMWGGAPSTGLDATSTPPVPGAAPAAMPPPAAPSLDQAADMYTMTPAEELSATNAAAEQAAKLKGMQDTNAATEQTTADAKQKAGEAGSLDNFIKSTNLYSDPVERLQSEVAFNRLHGTNYNVEGGQYSVYGHPRLDDGVQGPQPKSYTQGAYAPSIDDQNARDIAAANLAKVRGDNSFIKPLALTEMRLKAAQTKNTLADAAKTTVEAGDVKVDDWVKRYTALAGASNGGGKADPVLAGQQARLVENIKAVQQAQTNRTALVNAGKPTKEIDAYIQQLQADAGNVGDDITARLRSRPPVLPPLGPRVGGKIVPAAGLGKLPPPQFRQTAPGQWDLGSGFTMKRK